MSNKYWRGRTQKGKEFYRDRLQKADETIGQYTVRIFNLQNNLEPRLSSFAGGQRLYVNDDSEGREMKEWEKAQLYKSSIESGRYLAWRNRLYKENYINALVDLPLSREKKQEFRDKINSIPTNSFQYFSSLLPNLNDWYASRNSNLTDLDLESIVEQIETAFLDMGIKD